MRCILSAAVTLLCVCGMGAKAMPAHFLISNGELDPTTFGKAIGKNHDASFCSFACPGGDCPPDSCEHDMDTQDLEQSFEDGLELSGYDTSNFETYNLKDLATRLIGFEGCTVERGMPKAAVYSGWQQSWKLMNLMHEESREGIDLNSAAAFEFLGPPAKTLPQRSNFNSIFENLGTIQPGYVSTLLEWRIHVRCDDPREQCSCYPNLDSQPYAYTLSKGLGDGIAMINFCPKYFNEGTLDHALKKADRTTLTWQDMDNYKTTQGGTWFHELLHIDWVSKSGRYGDNIKIIDVKMMVTREDKDGNTFEEWVTAAGPLGTKILARWGIRTGYWTVQNAESFLMFVLATYVQKKVGMYPHLPVAWEVPKQVKGENGSSEYFKVPGLFTMFGDGTVEMDTNTTEFDDLSWDPADTCAVLADDTVNSDSQILTLSAAFAAESAYPTEYMSSWSSWAGLTAPTPIPSQTSTTAPPASTPIPSP